MKIEGSKIIEVRGMTRKEMEAEGWMMTMHGAPAVLVLDNGMRLYASADDEGNGPGAMFGVDDKGTSLHVTQAVGG